jgi:hypothetical protein
MADKKISELPLRGTVLPTDQFANSADNVTWRSPVSAITSLVTPGFIPVSQKGAAGGVATLGASGEVPASQLPENYIDEVGLPAGSDWTAVFQAAALQGGIFRLRPNTSYEIRDTVEVTTSGFGLIGTRSSRIYLPAASWTQVDDNGSAAQHATASAFYAHGDLVDANLPLHGFTMQGFTIESEMLEGRTLFAMFIRNVLNINISDLEIFGFPVGRGVAASTVSGWITRNYIHDFLQNSNPFSIQPQSSGIEIDGNRVGSPDVNSHDLIISQNTIRDILFTGAAAAAYGTQTDGINTQGEGAAARIIISGNAISRVGEGIDNFADFISMSANVIEECTDYGIKMTHGASYCSLTANTINKAGRAGILISGGPPTDSQHATGNVISGCTIKNIDYLGTYGATIPSACIRFWAGGGFTAKDNLILGCLLDPGTTGRYAISDDGLNNRQVNNTLTAGSVGLYANSADSLIPSPVGMGNFSANNAGGGQSGIADSAPVDVAFGNVLHNVGALYDSTTGIFTPKAGRVWMQACVRMTGTFDASSQLAIAIHRATSGGAGFGSFRGKIVAVQATGGSVDIWIEDYTTGLESYKVVVSGNTSGGAVAIPADGSSTFFMGGNF